MLLVFFFKQVSSLKMAPKTQMTVFIVSQKKKKEETKPTLSYLRYYTEV